MISLSVFYFFRMQEKNMSLLNETGNEIRWAEFYKYKAEHCSSPGALRELEKYITGREYLKAAASIARKESFPLPEKSVISKMSTRKKRTVYTYPENENYVLKLLTYLILRKYDYLFCDNLYSFRPGRGAKDAVRSLVRIQGISGKYYYKADISDYFNSVDIPLLLPMLDEAVSDDPELLFFLKSLLTEEYVIEAGKPVKEKKGIMAGTPLASFYANLYLAKLDRHFRNLHIPYARYSDDIILFADSESELNSHIKTIKDFLLSHGLSINPDKEQSGKPGEAWTFLGFIFNGKDVDIAPASVEKLKGKMRRKTKALRRWADRNEISGEKAALAFIRIFNRKLFENPSESELTWTHWFFPVITVTDSLKIIDNYAQECIRYLVSGKRTKSRYNVRYEEMKRLGYRSLVNAYYSYNRTEKLTEKQTEGP